MKSSMAAGYPATPTNVGEHVIQPSSEFKKEVTKVMSSIVFFIIVYIALMAGSILLALLCGYGGIMLIAAFPKFITLMVGLGLIGLGGMVIFFLLKFLFKSNTTDRSHLTRVTESDQPELFAFVRRLTEETQAPFPKNIYLSPDVNACVFYDSSFWSMFFPVRKNLQIGLGLVNAVNLSEFKAILAHEFGHFSQRSMKLGSYVYNVNQVIFNMLYDNDGYDRTLQSWANISGYFAFFAGMTTWIVRGIQKILQGMYSFINKNYMSLSRQMEFHADAVAAYVSGADHLVTSLRRLEVADICYSRLFQHYNEWYQHNLKPENIYPQHTEIMKHFAEDHGLRTDNGLPQVHSSSFANFNRSRVVVKDQWASHPSTDDREDHLNKLNIHTETDHSSAWVIFRSAETLQQQLTDKIYTAVEFKQAPQKLSISSFLEKYRSETEKYSLNKCYKGFYNNRTMKELTAEEIEKTASENYEGNLVEIFDDATAALPFLIDGLKADIHTVTMIEQEALPVKTFEFNGKRYDNDEASVVKKILNDELAEAEKLLVAADRRVMGFFLRCAEKQGRKRKAYHPVPPNVCHRSRSESR